MVDASHFSEGGLGSSSVISGMVSPSTQLRAARRLPTSSLLPTINVPGRSDLLVFTCSSLSISSVHRTRGKAANDYPNSQSERVDCVADADRDLLLAFAQIAYRIGVWPAAGRKLPEKFASGIVE